MFWCMAMMMLWPVAQQIKLLAEKSWSGGGRQWLAVRQGRYPSKVFPSHSFASMVMVMQPCCWGIFQRRSIEFFLFSSKPSFISSNPLRTNLHDVEERKCLCSEMISAFYAFLWWCLQCCGLAFTSFFDQSCVFPFLSLRMLSQLYLPTLGHVYNAVLTRRKTSTSAKLLPTNKEFNKPAAPTSLIIMTYIDDLVIHWFN